MQKTLKRDYLWNTIGVLAQNAVSPLLLIIVTRLNGIEDSGLFSFAFSLSLVLWSISMWGGRIYQVSDVKHEFSSRDYLTVRYILGVAVLLVAWLFSIANGYSTEKTLLIIALTSLRVFESIADAIYGVLQVRDKLYITGISLLVKAVSGIVVFSSLLLLTRSIFLSTVILIVNTLIFMIIFDVPWMVRSGAPMSTLLPNWRHWTENPIAIMRKSSPIFAMSILAILSINIPRYFIDKYHENQIGHFGIIAMPITLLTLFIAFVFQPNVVRLAKLYTTNKRTEFDAIVKRISFYVVLIGSAVIVGTYLIGAPVLSILFSVDFTAYKIPLVMVVIGALINTLVGVLMNTLVIMRHFKLQFLTLLLTNVVLIPLCLAIVPKYGFDGAVILYGATNLAQLVSLAIIYRSVLHDRTSYLP